MTTRYYVTDHALRRYAERILLMGYGRINRIMKQSPGELHRVVYPMVLKSSPIESYIDTTEYRMKYGQYSMFLVHRDVVFIGCMFEGAVIIKTVLHLREMKRKCFNAMRK